SAERAVEIRKTIVNYFADNKPQDTTVAATWLAHKAVIRGALIRAGATLKRKLEETSRAKLRDLRLAEDLHKSSPSDVTRQAVNKIRADLEVHQLQRVERALRKLK
ncbi:Hypothetical predicted protein, partial [Pelobates cultripes]